MALEDIVTYVFLGMAFIMVIALLWPKLTDLLVITGLIKAKPTLIHCTTEDFSQPSDASTETVKKVQVEMASIQANMAHLVRLMEQYRVEKEDKEKDASLHISETFLAKETIKH